MKRLLFCLMVGLGSTSLYAQSEESTDLNRATPSLMVQFSTGQALTSPMIWSTAFSPSFHGGLGFDLHHKFSFVVEGGYTQFNRPVRENQSGLHEQWYAKAKAYIPVFQIAPDAKIWVFAGGYYTEEFRNVDYTMPSDYYDPLEASLVLENLDMLAGIAGLALTVDMFKFMSIALESNLLVLPIQYSYTGIAADESPGFLRGLGIYRRPYNLSGDLVVRFHLPARNN
ncbi:MAG: hypothetical protein AAFQ98_04555 [Bacteroidota bacterium]